MRQKPIALSASAWCPGGRTGANAASPLRALPAAVRQAGQHLQIPWRVNAHQLGGFSSLRLAPDDAISKSGRTQFGEHRVKPFGTLRMLGAGVVLQG
jgi:hypothetical protein